MSEFSFNDLNLDSVDVASGGALAVGQYHAEVTEAIWKNTKNGGKMIEFNLRDLNGSGQIRTWVNVHVPSSEIATRIGREQLKALCVHGGHKDPDNVNKHGIASLVGLRPGISVTAESYIKDGQARNGTKVKFFFDPSKLPDFVADEVRPHNPPKEASFPDDVPF